MKRVIQSSALGYAISFLLLTGLVCSAVLFVSSVNKRTEVHYLIREHLVFDNLLAINYGADISENKELFLYHINGDTSKIAVKNWGAFKIVTARTFHKNQSVQKTAMIGHSDLYPYAVIYTPDANQSVKVCGDTKISGVFYGSERGLERGHISGKNYTRENLIEGETKIGEKFLPELYPAVKNLSIESFIEDVVKIELPSKDSVFSFDKQTSLVTSLEPITITGKFKGNLIIHSFHSIEIKKQASLENVILIAPIVTFEEEFSGTVQVVAHEQVILEERVKLSYPSTIILNEIRENKEKLPRGIVMKQGSMLVGGILMVSQKQDFRMPLELKINQATVGGMIYNVGQTEVIGKIHGYTYTNNFSVRFGGGEYKNHLVDAELQGTNLPKELIVPQWIETNEQKKNEIIKWL